MGWDHCPWCCLRVWRTSRQKITSVFLCFLLWGTRAQALSLVLKERMLLMGKVFWSSCSLLPLLSQGLFPPFHFHEKQKYWSWSWSCHAKWKEAEALLWVPRESQSVFHSFPALTRWGEAGTHLQASVMLKSKAVFDGSPCVSQKAEHVVRSSLSDPRGGRLSCNSQFLDALGVFYLH